jgi:hypothetical protein
MPAALQVESGTLFAVTKVAALAVLRVVMLAKNAQGSGRPGPSSVRVLLR